MGDGAAGRQRERTSSGASGAHSSSCWLAPCSSTAQVTVLHSLPATWLSVVPAWDQCCNSDHLSWLPVMLAGMPSCNPPVSWDQSCLQPGIRAANFDHLLRQPACQLSLPGISATGVRIVSSHTVMASENCSGSHRAGGRGQRRHISAHAR